MSFEPNGLTTGNGSRSFHEPADALPMMNRIRSGKGLLVK